MQTQYFPPPQVFQQQLFNPNTVRPEGCYQISPFGVVLQPIQNPSPISPPMSPPLTPIPISPISPQQERGKQVQSQAISPLSCGGYLYQMPPSPSPQTPQLSPPQPPTSPFPIQKTPNSPIMINPNISDDIKTRQDKLEKYREKRTKRNFNRQPDPRKSERASARTRDQLGHFVSEERSAAEQEKMRQALEESQMESQLLKHRLTNVQNELLELRRRAEEAHFSKQQMEEQLEAQQRMNQALMQENTLLWSRLPHDQVFNTIHPNAANYVDAFRQKVDLSNIELNWTDSKLLEAARMEEEYIPWEELILTLPGVRS